MYRQMCKSKIHRVVVTEANLNYVGSITIDSDLLEAANILPYEKVQVVNVNNGSRLETYAIAGEPGSGVICLNGAAARLAQAGDVAIIISYGLVEEKELADFHPQIVFVKEGNKIDRVVEEEIHGCLSYL
jgi:aspartate 1-decarboxylase